MIEWFVLEPLQLTAIEAATEAELQCGVMILYSGNPPDWVKLPPELTLSEDEQVLCVLESFKAPCAKCRVESRLVRHLRLDDGYYVSECQGCGFVWYRLNYSGSSTT